MRGGEDVITINFERLLPSWQLGLPNDASDEEIMEGFYHQYRESVYRHAYKYTHSKEEAEDITQQVFIKAWQHLDQYHGASDLKTWLFRITANVCNDWAKERKRAREVLQAWEQTQLTDGGYQPFQQVEELITQSEFWGVMWWFASSLPKTYQRTFFVMLWAEANLNGSVTMKHLSEMLGISENTVKTHIRRGRRLFAEMIAQSPDALGNLLPYVEVRDLQIIKEWLNRHPRLLQHLEEERRIREQQELDALVQKAMAEVIRISKLKIFQQLQELYFDDEAA
jgi:RNA polymerase sigma-70 factor, ECF subfamily